MRPDDRRDAPAPQPGPEGLGALSPRAPLRRIDCGPRAGSARPDGEHGPGSRGPGRERVPDETP